MSLQMRFKDPIKGEIPSDGEETLHYFLETVSTLSATSQWALLAQSLATFICGKRPLATERSYETNY